MATIDSLTLKTVPLGTDTIELNDGKKGTLASLPISTATQDALNDKANSADLGTAATRDVGQEAGNVLELSAAGTVLLGNATTGGKVRLYDEAGNDEIIDCGYLNGVAYIGGAQFPAFAYGTVALTSDLAAYVPNTRTVNGQALTGNITVAAAGSTLTDTVPVGKGGTGITAVGSNGNVLTSNGTAWVSSAPAGGGLTIGTTTITGGTSGRIQYNNAGVLGELAVGTGVLTAIGNATNGTGGFITWASAPSFTGLTITGSPTVSATGTTFQASAVLTAGGTGLYVATSGAYTAGARLQSFSDGVLRVSNNASAGGVSLNVATADTVRILNFANNAPGILGLGSSTTIRTGSGTPEGAVTATVGSLFLRTDGGAGTTLYVKESGTGNTGWAAK